MGPAQNVGKKDEKKEGARCKKGFIKGTGRDNDKVMPG